MRWLPLQRSVVLATFALGIGTLASPVAAQRPVDSIRTMYRVPPDSFLIGAWLNVIPTTLNRTGNYGQMARIWPHMDSLGVHVLHYMANPAWGDNGGAWGHRSTPADVDTLCWLAGPGQALIIKTVTPIVDLGWGREATFYPFDSTRIPDVPTRFTYLRGGGPTYSSVLQPLYNEVDGRTRGHRAMEYVPGVDTANQVVASGICYDWNPKRVYRFAHDGGLNHDLDSVQNADMLLSLVTSANQTEVFSLDTWYVVVTGHTKLSALPPSTELFRIEVVQEIPYGAAYGIDTLPHVAQVDTTRVYASFVVTRADFTPPGMEDWRQYREVAFPVNLSSEGILVGPLGALSSTKRFDIVVRYTGQDTAVLRSVQVRSATAQAALGRRPEDHARRSGAIDTAGRIIYGRWGWRQLGAQALADSMNARPILGLTSGIEQHAFEATSLNAVGRMLRDSVCLGAERFPAWTEDGLQTSIHHLEDYPEAVTVEVGMYTQNNHWQQLRTGPATFFIPSIEEHNGGRFLYGVNGHGTPLLEVTREGLEGYEKIVQRAHFGYNPGTRQRHDLYASLGNLAAAAMLARDSSRPLVVVPFTTHCFSLDTSHQRADSAIPIDSNIYHIPEPAELRVLAGLGLIYGSRGVWWQTLHGASNFVVATDSGSHGYTDMGTNNGFIDDTASHYDRFPLYGAGEDYRNYLNAPEVTAIEDYYSGFGTRTRAIRQFNQWLHRIGPELMKLRWRDAYSIHSTHGLVFDSPLPPLPANEIVTDVRTYAIGSGLTIADPDSATYVELGLFHTRNATSNPQTDTNYVAVLNRRVIERSDDLSSTSATGRALDSLCGARAILLELNVHPEIPPELRQYTFVRVREIAADSAAFPGSSQPRTPLDTIVGAEAAVVVNLPPARMALLEITYAPFDESFHSGVLARNAQRKFIWSARERRYHAVYHRLVPNGSDSRVYYRRSQIMEAQPGSILWEPVEYDLGSALVATSDTFRLYNAYPSMTLREWGDSAVVSVVWTCHRSTAIGGGDREIVRRNILSDTLQAVPLFAPIEHIGRHMGSDSSVWGTPVVARIDTGEIIVWSDEQAGLKARARIRASLADTTWWRTVDPTAYSAVASVPGSAPQAGVRLAGRFPSLPVSASVLGQDNHAGLAWQRSFDATGNLWEIWYGRLVSANKLAPGFVNGRSISARGEARHPSIDQFQDTIGSVFESVVWETPGSYYDTLLAQTIYVNAVCFQPLLTPVSQQNGVDVLGATGMPFDAGWVESSAPSPWQWNALPSIAALHVAPAPDGQYNTLPFGRDAYYGLYSVSWQEAWPLFGGGAPPLYSLRTTYDFSASGYDRYSYDGLNPATSASLVPEYQREAVLYQSEWPAAGSYELLRATRQFFARRTRPLGYMATGRMLRLPTGDTSVRGSVLIRLHDVWVSDADSARAIAPRRLDSTARAGLDTLGRAVWLLAGESFVTHDSVRIGLEIGGYHTGDAASYQTARFAVHVELADSASGAVVAALDSFELTDAADQVHRSIERELDLLSGRYYLRLRVDTASYQPGPSSGARQWTVEALASWVPDTAALEKVRRTSSYGAAERLTLHPNPVRDHSIVCFSIIEACLASIRVYDVRGRMVRALVEPGWYDRGRYEVGFDAQALRSGSYVLEMSCGPRRTQEPFVIDR